MTPTNAPSDPDDPLAAASDRLERACARLGARLEELNTRCRVAEAEAAAARDSDVDRARLAEALDAARAREAELETAAREADAALDEALSELSALIGAPEGRP